MDFLNDLKLILKYLKPYKQKVWFLIFLATIAAGFAGAVPFIYGRLFDQITKPDISGKIIIALISFWLLFTILRDWMERIIDKEGEIISVKTSNDLMLKATSHILTLPVEFHKEVRRGKIMSRLYQASNHLDMIIDNIVFHSLPTFLTLIFSLSIISIIEYRLALLLFLILIFYVAATVWKAKPIVTGQEKVQKTYDKYYSAMHEAVYNAHLVKNFTNEEYEKIKTEKSLKRILLARANFIQFWVTLDAWQQIIFGFGFVILFSSGIYFVRFSEITIGEFITFVGYVSMTFTPFAQLAGDYRWIKRGAVVIKRAEQILKNKPEPYTKKGAKLKKVKGEITFQNVFFRYENKMPILIDISFNVKAGEKAALVGESGVGKTTLIDLISRYYLPQKGRIFLDGVDIQKINLKFLRSQIAIVPQEITLFNDTIENNIKYAKPKATFKEIIEVAKAANADEFINKFPKKYKQLVGERGIKLSTGQKQRVAIARALLRNPKILILDEATSSLDSISENLVQEALSRLIKNRTTFIIAHRLSTITHADKIIVLENGKVAETGTHEKLLEKNGTYSRLYDAQKF